MGRFGWQAHPHHQWDVSEACDSSEGAKNARGTLGEGLEASKWGLKPWRAKGWG